MRTVTAVARAGDILDLVAWSDEPLRIGAIAARLRLPRNTTYELVHTLADRQLLTVDQHGVVQLGVRLFELGSRYANGIDWLIAARGAARGLRDLAGETIHVAALDGRDAVYLIKEDSPKAVRIRSAVGQRIPAHLSAVGKALLSMIPDAELRRLIGPGPLEQWTTRSISDIDALLADLASARERGYAIDVEESSPEVSCVAAPIRDHSGRVLAAMSVSVPVSRMTGENQRALGDLVRATAADLSTRLGHRN